MIQINFYKIESLTDIKNKLMITKGENMGGRDKSRAWDEHTHATTCKRENQQGPTGNTGNFTQYSVITCMRKDSEKNEYMYMYN